jgi:Flp pilus assembly protein TadG
MRNKRQLLYQRRSRRAGVTLELILGLPVLVIVLLIVVELGLIMGNSKHVAAASREGAKLAAEAATLNPGNTAAVTAMIRVAIDRRLASAGLGNAATRGVTLRHTVGGGGSATSGSCPDPVVPVLPNDAVRVTVCVEMTRLSPNLLSIFGFDLTGRVVRSTTTYDYELN